MPSSAVFRFSDPYEYAATVRPACLEILLTAHGDFRAELTQIDLHRLRMQRGRTSLPHIGHSSVKKDRSVVFFLADDCQKAVYHSGKELLPGSIVANSSGAEHHHRTSSECLWGAMSLTPEDLAVTGRALVERDLAAPAATQVIRPPPHLMSRLLHWHEAAGHLATTAPDILAHSEIARAIEDELVRVMVACLTNGMAKESRGLGYQRVPIMRRFERALEANQERPIYLTEVCAAVGVSGRTLRTHCQEQLGMSPHRYLWLRRMNLARRALALADPTATTVSVIAMDNGFGELGRFAVSYRKLFGEMPSTTPVATI